MNDGGPNAASDLSAAVKTGAVSPRAAWPLREVLLGGVLGIDAIGLCLALATICFSGGLIAGLGLATAIFLASTALMTFVLVKFSAFSNAVSVTQDTSIAILAAAVAVAGAGAMGGEPVKVATAFAVIGCSAVLSGAAFLAVGVLGLGRVVRLVPYPVAAGFLASSGWLLVLSALLILTKTNSSGALSLHLQNPGTWMTLVPALALAAVLLVSVRLGGGSLVLVAVIVAAVAVFHVLVFWNGMGLEGARSSGLLQKIIAPESTDFSPASLYTLIDWRQVAASAPVLAAVVVVNLIGFLLNVSGVELAARRDVDVNHESELTGAANLMIGAVGGAANFMTSGSTTVAQKIAAGGPALGLSYGVMTLIGCFFAHQIISLVPIFVAAGLLIFIGVSMISDWLLGTRRRLALSDWLIVVAIVAVTIVSGILTAIVFGLVLAVFSFAIGYAQLPVVRYASTGLQRRSTLERAPEEDAVLQSAGNGIRILQLQGYLFFGSVERLIDQLRVELNLYRPERGATGQLVLDFSTVTGIDSAGCAALGKLAYVAQNRGFNVHLAALPQNVLKSIDRWQLDLSGATGLRHWPTVDSALEACETALVNAHLGQHRAVSVRTIFDRLTGSHRRMDDLLKLMTPIDLAVGETLIEQGARSGDIYILESGRLAVTLAKSSGASVKLRSHAPGSVVGEVACYRDKLRTAKVTAETASRVYRLSEEDFDRVEREDRDLAALIHAMLARSLAEKVAQTNRLVFDH